MKRLFLYLALAVFPFVAACGHAGEKTQKKEPDKIHVTELSEDEFAEMIYNFRSNSDSWKYEGTKPAIVDFYAPWCGPCRTVAPIIEELAAEYEGRITVYKVNVDHAKGAAQTLGISSIPAVMFIPVDGQPQMVVGARPKALYQNTAEKYLLKN